MVEIDSVGIESQGVVTYNVKISFVTQDESIKAGMSATGDIITETKQNVLVVPNSAVKSLPALPAGREQAGQNGRSYVEMFDEGLSLPESGVVGVISKTPPNKVQVEVGITNDSHSEIISGIKEGDEVVTRTISGTATSTTTAPSIFGSPSRTR